MTSRARRLLGGLGVLWGPLGLAAVAGGLGPEVWASAPARAETEAPPRLRYLTLNLLHGGVLSGLTGDDGDLEARLGMVVEALRALDPDIVGLQEASVSRRRGNVAERLARELGYYHVHAPVLAHLFEARWLNRFAEWVLNFDEGPALLSRFPIVAPEVRPLPRCNGFLDPRVLLYARVQTPWGDLGVASAHTSRGFCEASQVTSFILERRGLLPIVLMGDFNAVETSPGITTLTGHAGVLDVFRAANPGAPGLTVWQRIRALAPTVFRRVDYLFLLPGTVVPGRVLASRVVLDAPRRLGNGAALWPSDHYGVVADIDVFGQGGSPTPAVARSR